jgi:hypothetical protein
MWTWLYDENRVISASRPPRIRVIQPWISKSKTLPKPSPGRSRYSTPVPKGCGSEAAPAPAPVVRASLLLLQDREAADPEPVVACVVGQQVLGQQPQASGWVGVGMELNVEPGQRAASRTSWRPGLRPPWCAVSTIEATRHQTPPCSGSSRAAQRWRPGRLEAGERFLCARLQDTRREHTPATGTRCWRVRRCRQQEGRSHSTATPIF